MGRLDKLIVDLGLVDTRNKAQLLIEEGVVFVDGVQILKPAFKTESTNIEIKKETLYVGRGAHKIEGALLEFNVSVKDFVVADVGASTGGFTEYVLNHGAKKVFAIDVGHDQLASKLRQDSRVINLEGVNIRALEDVGELCDLAVVDLSFISIKLVLKNIFSLLKEKGQAIVLIKPQFEVGRNNLNKKGVCTDFEVIADTLKQLLIFSNENQFYIRSFTGCSIKGGSGNQEFFFHYDKSLEHSLIESSDIDKIVEKYK